MGIIATTGSSVFRDYITDGVPGSGPNKPVKADIRSLFALIDGLSLNAAKRTVTSNYAIVDGDAGSTIECNTGGVTVTFGSATGFVSTSHFNLVTNTSALVVKVAVSGYTTFKLWPGQTAFIFRVGSVWQIDRDSLYYTPAGFTIHVNHGSGNDNNDGLSIGTAVATVQKAINILEFEVDCAGNGPTIQIDDASFTENNVVHTFKIRGYHVIYIVGDHNTPGNCIWNVGAGSTGLTCRDWSGVILDGVRMVATGSGATGVSSSQHGIVDIQNVEFGAFASGNAIESTNGGSVGYVVGAVSAFLGNCAALWQVGPNSALLCSGVTINLPSALTFSNALSMVGGSAIFSGVTFGGTGAGSGSTGAKYGVDMNGIALLNGTVLPGASAGSTSRGGEVS